MHDDPTDTLSIAARLRMARARRFLRPEDAARAAGMPLATWYGHENGSRGLRAPTLARIRDTLGVSLDWLITGQGPMDPPSFPVTPHPGRPSRGRAGRGSRPPRP